MNELMTAVSHNSEALPTAETSEFHSAKDAIHALTRYIPDHPIPGVLFEDLTPVLAHPEGLRRIIDELSSAIKPFEPAVIGGLDARGFLLASAVAYKLGLGVLAIRKGGKLPPPVYSRSFELEYGSSTLEIPASGIDLADKRVVLVDDVLATGGTLVAARELIREAGGDVVAYAVLNVVANLGGTERLSEVPLIVINDSSAPDTLDFVGPDSSFH